MRIPSLYLDTSVLGGYFDDEWQEPTQELWRQMEEGQWRFVCSDVTTEEIEGAPERVRLLFFNTFPPETLLATTDEMEVLAAACVVQGVVTGKYQDDARHVAACTVSGLNLLVSWNFRHLVSLQRETGFNAVNLLQGYQIIRIVSPLELIYGNQDKSL
ncbi:MAG TPA: hypothetical protein VIS74_07405 [Chthoniobacterales bacterium]